MRLTKKERRESKQSLGVWHSPSEMMTHVRRLMDELGSVDLFNRAGVDFLTEAWIAADLGGKRAATTVRLITEAERPDIELRFAHGGTEVYEIVEADRPDRNRGHEFEAWEDAGYPVYQWPIGEWATPEQAYKALRKGAEIKAKRAAELAANGMPYPPETRLLFYLNLVDFGARTAEIEEVMPAAVDPARPWFASVWVHWKLQVYQV